MASDSDVSVQFDDSLESVDFQVKDQGTNISNDVPGSMEEVDSLSMGILELALQGKNKVKEPKKHKKKLRLSKTRVTNSVVHFDTLDNESISYLLKQFNLKFARYRDQCNRDKITKRVLGKEFVENFRDSFLDYTLTKDIDFTTNIETWTNCCAHLKFIFEEIIEGKMVSSNLDTYRELLVLNMEKVDTLVFDIVQFGLDPKLAMVGSHEHFQGKRFVQTVARLSFSQVGGPIMEDNQKTSLEWNIKYQRCDETKISSIKRKLNITLKSLLETKIDQLLEGEPYFVWFLVYEISKQEYRTLITVTPSIDKKLMDIVYKVLQLLNLNKKVQLINLSDGGVRFSPFHYSSRMILEEFEISKTMISKEDKVRVYEGFGKNIAKFKLNTFNIREKYLLHLLDKYGVPDLFVIFTEITGGTLPFKKTRFK